MRSPQTEATSAPKAPATTAAGPASQGGRPAHPRDGLLRLQRQYGNRQTRGIIQAKLNVGPADDEYEREADRLSRLATGTSVQRAPEPVQRVAGASGGAAGPAAERSVRAARGAGGRPVPGGIRKRMEQVTGADFGGVRMHVDAESDRLNDALSSRAFTVGADVFVRRSEYRPGSARGDALLGHELTHTVQQGAAQPLSSPAPARVPATPVAQRAGEEDQNNRRGLLTRINRALRQLHKRLRPEDSLNIGSPIKTEATFGDRDREPTEKQEDWEKRTQEYEGWVEQTRQMGRAGSTNVAHRVHFAWLGDSRELTSHEKENIESWTEKARQADSEWKIHLWMDAAAENTNPDFSAKVRPDPNAEIRSTETELHGAAKAAFDSAVERSAYTQASDILRLMVLSSEGGIYLDVDIAPGRVNLPSELTIDSAGIPFFAPNMQDEDSVITDLGHDRNEEKLGRYQRLLMENSDEDLSEFHSSHAERLWKKGSLNNNFIIAARGMHFLNNLLDRIVNNMNELARKSSNNDTVDVTGFRMIQTEILRLLDVNSDASTPWEDAVRTGRVAFDATRINEWRNIEWITKASSRERHEEA